MAMPTPSAGTAQVTASPLLPCTPRSGAISLVCMYVCMYVCMCVRTAIYLVCIYVRTQFPTLDDHAEEDFRAKLTSVVQHLAPGHHLDLKFSSDEKHGEDVKVSVSVHDS